MQCARRNCNEVLQAGDNAIKLYNLDDLGLMMTCSKEVLVGLHGICKLSIHSMGFGKAHEEQEEGHLTHV